MSKALVDIERKAETVSLIERAKALATEAHREQVDKAGRPYISHPARVAQSVAGDESAECVAWLHDVAEDTAVTSAQIRQEFGDVIADAVDAVTRRDGELDVEYYMRVVANEIARKVKLADIADNSDPERLALLDSHLRERLTRKYEAADRAVGHGARYYLTPDSHWRIDLESGALCFEDWDAHGDWGHSVEREHLGEVYAALGIAGLEELIDHLRAGGDVSPVMLAEHGIPHELFRWP